MHNTLCFGQNGSAPRFVPRTMAIRIPKERSRVIRCSSAQPLHRLNRQVHVLKEYLAAYMTEVQKVVLSCGSVLNREGTQRLLDDECSYCIPPILVQEEILVLISTRRGDEHDNHNGSTRSMYCGDLTKN